MGTFEGLEPGDQLNPETVRAIEVFKLLTGSAGGRRGFTVARDNEERQALYQGLIEEMLELPEDDERLPPALKDPEAREKFRDVRYETIPEGIRVVLEKLSDSELALLSDLDAAYVEAGLSLTSNPVPCAVH
jgi:hypothetical protein